MTAFATTVFVGLQAVLALVIVIRMLRGDINLNGLFSSTSSGALEPERVQALIVTLAVPAFYAAETLGSFRASDAVVTLPDVPEWLLILATGSQTLYLSGKIARNAAST